MQNCFLLFPCFPDSYPFIFLKYILFLNNLILIIMELFVSSLPKNLFLNVKERDTFYF